MISGLILAAGESRRMGTPKALLTIGGETFLGRLVHTASSVCDPVLVVLGYHAGVIRGSIDVPSVINPDPERGMLSSLQCGLRALPPDTEAIIFTPVDYPNVEAGTFLRIAATFRTEMCEVVIPRYQGTKGHPVCVSRKVLHALLDAPVTSRADDILGGFLGTTRFIDVDDPAITADIDTPADYAQLLAGQPA